MDDLSSVFDAFFGQRKQGRPASGQRATRAHRAQPRRGSDVRLDLTVDFTTAALGGKRSVRYTSDDRADRSIEVSIPRAIASGSTLRLRGEGNPAPPGGEPGDLLVTVTVAPHPVFKRGKPLSTDGTSLDLHFELPISVAEAILGGRIDIPTLSGTVGMTIPPGTSSGRTLRLKGRGLEGRDGNHGDLYAVVAIVVPREADLDLSVRSAIEALAAATPSPRTGPGWS
jgi:DnaJ-class molecular chaperone